MLWCRDVKKVFLLNQYDEWKQYLSSLNAELANASGRDRTAQLERVGKAAEWLAHHARLLQVGHDVHLKP